MRVGTKFGGKLTFILMRSLVLWSRGNEAEGWSWGAARLPVLTVQCSSDAAILEPVRTLVTPLLLMCWSSILLLWHGGGSVCCFSSVISHVSPSSLCTCSQQSHPPCDHFSRQSQAVWCRGGGRASPVSCDGRSSLVGSSCGGNCSPGGELSVGTALDWSPLQMLPWVYCGWCIVGLCLLSSRLYE